MNEKIWLKGETINKFRNVCSCIGWWKL